MSNNFTSKGLLFISDPRLLSFKFFHSVICTCPFTCVGSPRGLDAKESACNAGDLGSIPGSGRSPGKGNGNPLQYSCLGNPMDRKAWWAIVHGVTKSQRWLRDYHVHFSPVWAPDLRSLYSFLMHQLLLVSFPWQPSFSSDYLKDSCSSPFSCLFAESKS